MLRSAGVPYELRHGRRHIKLKVRGRLALVLPRGSGETLVGRRNARATLQRFLRGEQR